MNVLMGHWCIRIANNSYVINPLHHHQQSFCSSTDRTLGSEPRTWTQSFILILSTTILIRNLGIKIIGFHRWQVVRDRTVNNYGFCFFVDCSLFILSEGKSLRRSIDQAVPRRAGMSP